MTEQAKPEFPRSWDTCPNCGSTQRLVNDIREELIAQGKWDPKHRAALLAQQSAFFDPSRLAVMLTVPVLMVELDACADCGTVYVTYADMKQGTPQMVKSPPKPGMPGGLPGFKPFPS